MDLAKQRSTAIARSLVSEIGTQSKTAKVVGVSQPTIAIWIRNGIGRTRENDLRFRFPNLETWKLFPALEGVDKCSSDQS